MKVLYFHQHFSTLGGATGVRSYHMAQALLRGGHEVTMVCGSYAAGKSGLTGEFVHGRREGVVDGIRVIEFAIPYSNADSFVRRTKLFIAFAARSSMFALREQCDVIFATSTPLTAGIPGIIARWLRGRRFVFEVRDLWPELPRAMGVIRNPIVLGAMSILEYVSYHSAHRLVGLSPGIVEGIERRGIASARIALIPNGSDVAYFGSGEPWRPAGVTPDDCLAVFSGTHGIANGLHAALDAAGELKRRGRKDIKLALVGQGKLKPALQQRARNEGLDNVLFLDPVEKQRLVGLLAGADIGLQLLSNTPAFYYGTSPNKFFDYIAAGLPVLNNYPGWLADMIREHECGYAVPPDDPNAFADALEHAADHRDELRRLGERSRGLAERFDMRELGVQFVEWLESAGA